MNNVNNMYYQNYYNVNDIANQDNDIIIQRDLTNKEKSYLLKILQKKSEFYDFFLNFLGPGHLA